MHEYSPADLKRLFHLPSGLLRALNRAGYTTVMQPEGATSYSFQDLLMFRTASALRAAKIPAAKIVAALGNIRATLPPGALLTTLALSAAGNKVVVRDGKNEWEEQSGQYALPLEARQASRVVPLVTAANKSSRVLLAEQHYVRGHELEESDVTAARAAYLDALNSHGDHLHARINLGRLLHLDGELKAAEKVYREAKSSSALLSFNLAILLEDLNREEEAIVAYREALAQDPHMHDAHFNLSRLHEQARRPREALRHLLAYRRHVRQAGQ